MKRIVMTQTGIDALKREFESLTEKRKTAVQRLRTAREMGDLSENGAYKAARFELTAIDRRLRYLTLMTRIARVVQQDDTSVVNIGCSVSILDDDQEKKLCIVSGYETNPAEGKISDSSPIGRALMGKKVGDQVVVHIPSGDKLLTVTSISYD